MIIKIPKEKKPVTTLTRAQEAALDRKMEDRFKSQRELKNGRNFRFNTMRFITTAENQRYRQNFDKIKWNSTPPGQGL